MSEPAGIGLFEALCDICHVHGRELETRSY